MNRVKSQNLQIRNKAGFSLIEILLAVSIFVGILSFLLVTILYGEESMMLAGNRGQASILAEEGLEAARNIRDGDGFAALSVGTHGLAISSNEWTFSGTSDTTGIFRREIEIVDIDTDRKEVTSTVTWQQNAQRTGELIMNTYFTNWQDNTGQGNAGQNLLPDVSGVSLDSGDNTMLTGLTIENTGATDITILEMSVAWTGGTAGSKVSEISIDSSSVWAGTGNSGDNLDITDFTLLSGAGTYAVDYIDFSKEMSGATITVTFIMSDASTKEAVITLGEDVTPPAAVDDFSTSNATVDSIDLTWTAPGDDDTTGTATSYDVRYSEALINSGNWVLATPASDEPTPAVAGSTETMTVSGLDPGTTYYFAIKTSDEVPSISAISNIASATTTAFIQANYLKANPEGAIVNPFDATQVTGIILSNEAEQKITISTMIVSWVGGSKGNNINAILIGGAEVWSGNGNSGDKLDIKDFILDAGQSYKVDYLDFKKKIAGAILEITFIMRDGSDVTISNIKI